MRRPRIAAVFRGAAEGLGRAHEAGIIHRDYKPSNGVLAACSAEPVAAVKFLRGL